MGGCVQARWGRAKEERRMLLSSAQVSCIDRTACVLAIP